MSYSPIAFIAPNYRDYPNYWLKAYEPATTTTKPIALDSNGDVQVARLQLNADGFFVSAGQSISMPYIDGRYDAYLFPTEAEADSNDTSNAIRVADDILGANGEASAADIMTLQQAIENTSAQEGDYVSISDRGFAIFKYAESLTPNGYNVISTTVGLFLSLQVEDNIKLEEWGVIDGQEVSDVIFTAASLYDLPIILSNNVLCDEISGLDYLDLRLNGATINNNSSNNLFRNISNFKLSGVGEIGTSKPYFSYVYIIESGSNLDVVNVSGDITIDCSDITTTAFWCDPGVNSSTAPQVSFKGIEITGFNRSGIELAMDAPQIDASFYVGFVKSHSGSGRCIQFGNNDYSCWNVTVQNCPRLGDVFSSGSAEAKGVLVYGENVDISNNIIESVKNESVSGAEGIYVKASFCTIHSNKMLNAGSSSDGCITIKGSEYFESGTDQQGEWSIISGNNIRMTHISYDSKGIGIFDSNVLCHHNILTDLRGDRGSLSYSMSISVGGSNIASNVIVDNNQSVGWATFCGDFSESTKGRQRFGDNVKIRNNTAINLVGDSSIMYRADAETSTRRMIFSSVGNSVTIDGGDSQNAQFGRYIYPVGSEVVVSGTSSNDGVYTVASVSRYTLTFSEPVNTLTEDANITRLEIHNLEIKGNTFQGSDFGIRNFAGRVRNMVLDDNTYIDMNNSYRLTQANGIGILNIGSNESHINIDDIDFGQIQADSLVKGVNATFDDSTNLTISTYDKDFIVSYV